MEDQSFLDNTLLPCGSSGPQEQISIFDYSQRYEENICKAHTCATDLPCQAAMQLYHQFAPNYVSKLFNMHDFKHSEGRTIKSIGGRA
jgi:hypothetical protein